MPTFKEPNVFEPHPEDSSRQRVDKKRSEEYRLFDALGRHKVIYAVKENRYYKDFDCSVPYKDEEIQELGLPVPVDIAILRKKLVEKALEEGPEALDMDKIYAVTTPKGIEPPPRIKEKLVQESDEDKMIRRINRSALGRRG